LVNNAGLVLAHLGVAHSSQDLRRLFEGNVLATFLCIREVIPTMLRRRRGSIVCLSSRVSDRGAPGLLGYSAAKAGVEAMVRTLAVELARKGIRVNGIAPGLIRTDMTERHITQGGRDAAAERVPMRRFGEPEEVACVVRFLASDDASYINGEVIHVDGGLGV
jgi:3-oxoacyl-[acyl-carrier protein] reductase